MKPLTRQCPFSSPCELLGNIPDYWTKGFCSWKCWSLKDAPCSPLLDSLLYTSTSATKRSKHNLLRGRVRGIGFKYHGACKPSHRLRICQQTETEQDMTVSTTLLWVRHPHTPAPTGDQRSSNQVQGLKLDSMAQEGARMGSAVNAAHKLQMGIWGAWNYAGKGETRTVTSALVTSGK